MAAKSQHSRDDSVVSTMSNSLVSIATATTDVSWTIPNRTKKVQFRNRDIGGTIHYSSAAIGTYSTYLTAWAGEVKLLENCVLNSRTLYFSTPDSSAEIEIEHWR